MAITHRSIGTTEQVQENMAYSHPRESGRNRENKTFISSVHFSKDDDKEVA